METRPMVLTPKQAAALLGLSRQTVYAALECGDLPGRKVLNKWLIGASLLWRWFNTRPESRPTPANPNPSWPDLYDAKGR